MIPDIRKESFEKQLKSWEKEKFYGKWRKNLLCLITPSNFETSKFRIYASKKHNMAIPENYFDLLVELQKNRIYNPILAKKTFKYIKDLIYILNKNKYSKEYSKFLNDHYKFRSICFLSDLAKADINLIKEIFEILKSCLISECWLVRVAIVLSLKSIIKTKKILYNHEKSKGKIQDSYRTHLIDKTSKLLSVLLEDLNEKVLKPSLELFITINDQKEINKTFYDLSDYEKKGLW